MVEFIVENFAIEVWMHERTINRYESWIFLALPVALYLFLCILYLFAIPPGESPDEPSHLQCIEQVAILNRIPIVEPRPRGLWWSRERVISGLTCYHLPLYYLFAGYTQKALAQVTGAALHYEFPPTDPNFATGASVAMFAHEDKPYFLALTEPFTLTALRIESILLGLLVLWATYRLTRRLAPTLPDAPLLAMMLVAGWSQFVFMSRAINNDVLAGALTTAVLAALVGDDQPRRYVAASALTGAAILSKLPMAFCAGVVALSWVVEWLGALDKVKRIQMVRFALISALLFGILIALLILHPTLRGNIRTTAATITPLSPAAQTTVYWENVLKTTLQSGWGRYGWMNLATPDSQVYVWWGFLAITGVTGLIVTLRRSREDSRVRYAFLISIVWIICVLAVYARIQINRFQPQFRYAFSMIPVLAAFSGAGIAALLNRSARWPRLALVGLAGLLFLVNLWIIFAILVPAYA
jgi:hypothetical protein